MKRSWSVLILAALLPIALHAQGSDTSATLFDFEPSDEGLFLVVAMQPHEAFEIVRTHTGQSLDLEQFRTSKDILAAFVEGRVLLRQNELPCRWEASTDPVPEALLDAYAEGITVRGIVRCPAPYAPFILETDLFTDRFPGHQNVARYYRAGNYEAFATLTAADNSAVVQPALAVTGPAFLARSWHETAWLAGIAFVAIAGIAGILFIKTKRASSR